MKKKRKENAVVGEVGDILVKRVRYQHLHLVKRVRYQHLHPYTTDVIYCQRNEGVDILPF
jgi:hypothetical protein